MGGALSDDRGLLERLRSGDTTAAGELFQKYAPSLLRFADRLLSDDQLSQTLKICGGLIQPMPSALSEPQASETRVKRRSTPASP